MNDYFKELFMDIHNKHENISIRRGRAYMICFYFVAVGIMLSELCRRVF